MKKYILSGLLAFVLLVSASSVVSAEALTAPRSGGGGSTAGTATSTIKNVSIQGMTSFKTVNFYDSYTIEWEGTNLRKVNIDLYDFKGLYKKRTIAENYDVTFSTTSQKFKYSWDVDFLSLNEDVYVVKVSDALNKKVQAKSTKINFEWYKYPTVGNIEYITPPVAKVISDQGGNETAIAAEFIIKINAVSDTFTLSSGWFGMDAERISPLDSPGEFSTKYTSGTIERTSGEFSISTTSSRETIYKIAKGKSAVFKIAGTFKPSEMFAGQYQVVLGDIYVMNSQNKYAKITNPGTATNKLTILGEKSPFIYSVTSPTPLNKTVILTGVRLDPKSNVAISSEGATYTLPGAKDDKISFVPSKVGMKEGYIYFQIKSPNGASNNVWMEIKPALNGANVFSAFWSLFRSAI